MSGAVSAVYEFPVGRLYLESRNGALTRIERTDAPCADTGDGLVLRAKAQLDEYFAGKRKDFDLPLAAEGTVFQTKVWAALQTIPYGETRTYGELAAMIGQPKASRAVGGANHRNPLAIVIPCHRVIGADGGLTGYGGGLPMKEYLIKLEQKFC
ncbi:MAG: methylated-DNA--[protein]-cysteine S-methyltransferase [Oscillospiraceae bacterium]|jgi:methylated-DNA-[protein]-cysteine S-methyltransferase